MKRFVHEQNLFHYMDLLENECDPARRAQLSELLIKEEDSFGAARFQLMELEQLIYRAVDHVQRQQNVVDALDGASPSAPLARNILQNMQATLDILRQRLRQLRDDDQIQ